MFSLPRSIKSKFKPVTVPKQHAVHKTVLIDDSSSFFIATMKG